jgi:hypothetical protein
MIRMPVLHHHQYSKVEEQRDRNIKCKFIVINGIPNNGNYNNKANNNDKTGKTVINCQTGKQRFSN